MNNETSTVELNRDGSAVVVTMTPAPTVTNYTKTELQGMLADETSILNVAQTKITFINNALSKFTN